MSDIKAGDLVEIALPTECCNHSGAVGCQFVVQDIVTVRLHTCIHCWKNTSIGLVAVKPGRCMGIALRRLRKIPPLNELESIPSRDEVTG